MILVAIYRHRIARIGHCHVPFVGEFIQSLLTALRFFARTVQLLLVRVHVLHHVILTNKALAALDARERLTSAMQAHVTSQIGLVIELFRTLLALERFVATVFSDMFLV